MDSHLIVSLHRRGSLLDVVLCVELEDGRVRRHCVSYRCRVDSGTIQECRFFGGDLCLDEKLRNVANPEQVFAQLLRLLQTLQVVLS